MMVDRINDILWQAQQGSVAAIIQVLNQRLASSGVRTRAMFSNGVLQLLCEARSEDRLEKSSLVNTIRQIIEQIAPRNIYKINVNSRIVREQQLLWLEEISRDPDNQLLWSEEITLEKPNALQQFVKDFQERKTEPKISFPKAQAPGAIVIYNKKKSKNSAWGWFFLGVSLCLCFGVASLAIYNLFGNHLKVPILKSNSNTPTPITKSVEPQNSNNLDEGKSQSTPNQNNLASIEDPFADAVRIANQTTASGKKARNSTQWLEVAASWQRASDLMSKVPQSHSRYQEALIRTKLYRQYSEAAQKEAEKNN
ncbi:hypothetical protein NIES4071_23060 [Calothrix sp. NIES-4071]|nr:hypothetical protein NIES4071_23060 [Calothrix sp. NIES-4071]BAZ56636.1 hypothetical protein NIES4105_23010 [Calothrix sp. NIES-4105]